MAGQRVTPAPESVLPELGRIDGTGEFKSRVALEAIKGIEPVSLITVSHGTIPNGSRT
jgi:hypothetical protein